MKNSLTNKDVKSLIKAYESDIRQLEYKIIKTREALSELTGNGNGSKTTGKRGRPRKEINYSADTVQSPPKKRGRPRKVILEDGDPTGPGTPKVIQKKKSNTGKKEKVKLVFPKVSPRKPRTISSKSGGYRLSEWDNFVLDSLENFGKVMINSELYDLALQKNEADKMGLTDEDVRGKLVRSIHKLANKRMEIAKAPFPGKGYAYGLSSWFSGSGNLKKTYSR